MNKFSIVSKLKIINTAKNTGNIKQTCQTFNISRTQFYHYKKTFEKKGVLGLSEQANRIKRRYKCNQTVINEIINLALTFPLLSLSSLTKKLTNKKLSTMGLYNILKAYRLESKQRRWRFFENAIKSGNIRRLSTQQRLFLTNINPCFAYYDKVSYPAQAVSQDVINYTHNNKKYYLYVIVDRYSYYAFTYLSTDKQKQHSIKLLSDAITQFSQQALTLGSVYASYLKMFQGAQDCPYQQLLSQYAINFNLIDTRPEYDHCIEYFLTNIKQKLAHYADLSLDNKTFSELTNQYNTQYYNSNYPHYNKSPAQMIDYYLRRMQAWNKSSKILARTPNFLLPVIHVKDNKRQIFKQAHIKINKKTAILFSTQNTLLSK